MLKLLSSGMLLATACSSFNQARFLLLDTRGLELTFLGIGQQDTTHKEHRTFHLCNILSPCFSYNAISFW